MRKPANRAWSQTWATGANNAPGASAALEPLSTEAALALANKGCRRQLKCWQK